MSSRNVDSGGLGSPKKIWTKPELKRLVPGSAESGPKDVISDGTQGNVKS